MTHAVDTKMTDVFGTRRSFIASQQLRFLAIVISCVRLSPIIEREQQTSARPPTVAAWRCSGSL
jgi:hypothetical protein